MHLVTANPPLIYDATNSTKALSVHTLLNNINVIKRKLSEWNVWMYLCTYVCIVIFLTYFYLLLAAPHWLFVSSGISYILWKLYALWIQSCCGQLPCHCKRPSVTNDQCISKAQRPSGSVWLEGCGFKFMVRSKTPGLKWGTECSNWVANH